MNDQPAIGSPSPIRDRDDDRVVRESYVTTRLAAPGEDRSPNAWVCPFLRSIDEDDALGLPVESPDPANRCAALRDAVPQSLRQQELVCLTSGHVNCPRYLRGSVGADEPTERVHAVRSVTPAIAGSLALFAAAFLISLTFVVANGGLVLTAAAPTPSASDDGLGAIATASPTPGPTPLATPLASPTPLESPIPTPSQAPISTPIPTPTARPTAPPAATPKPTSSRLALLTRCPDAPNCYIYVIRSGDNLSSIANYFGVSLKSVKAMNPWLVNGLKVGHDLRMPPPTR